MSPGAMSVSLGGCLGTWGSALGEYKNQISLMAMQNPRQRANGGGRQLSVRIEARDRQRRLLSYVLSMPQRIDRYLESSWWRKWSWAGISLCSGFYTGNIATLSFGALAVNDVLAAVITLLFCEVVTHMYYTAKEPSLFLWYLNSFKIGLIASLLADAAKLGS